ERGDLLLARSAPGRPNVHQGDVAAIGIAEGDGLAGLDRHRGEVGCHGADADWGHGAAGQGESHEQDRAHHQPAPAALRSARTASAGSGAPNTAVPATKVSAPARCASAIVSVVMPPSTSSTASELCESSSLRTRLILSVEAGM